MFSFGRFGGEFSLKVLMVRRLCLRRVVATHRRQAVSPVRQVVTSRRLQVVMPLTEELKGTNADASKNEDLLQGRGVYPEDCSMEEMIGFCAQFVDGVNNFR